MALVRKFSDSRETANGPDRDVPENRRVQRSFENTVACFTPGTRIATPKGERLVQDLVPGERVITRDNGLREIRWAGRRDMLGTELNRAPHLRPILILQGALGNGLPERDMMVSPNHRMLVTNDKTALYFKDREVLVAAKHLIGLPGVSIADVKHTAYIHFMCDQHEVVLADGAWTESFQPEDKSLIGVGNAQRLEIFELFPDLKSPDGLRGYRSARQSLRQDEARFLVH